MIAVLIFAFSAMAATSGSTKIDVPGIAAVDVGTDTAQASHNCFWSLSSYTDHIHTNCTFWVSYWEARGWVCFYYDSWGNGHGNFYLKRR